jgi:hypothetical protein
MKLAQVDAVIKACEDHLTANKAFGTDVEKFLTGYLVVMTYSALEEFLEDAIRKRAERTGDKVLASLVSSAIGIVLRSIGTGELSGVLNRFGEDHKKAFRQRMDANPQAETSYNSIIGQRHNVAHTATFTLSFREFVNYYESGHVVLDAFSDVVAS